MDILSIAAVFVVMACLVLALTGRQVNGSKPVPGPKSWPIIGNAHQIDNKMLHTCLYEWMKTYGDIFQFTILGTKNVVINSAELFDYLLQKFICRPPIALHDINHNRNGVTMSDNMFLVAETNQGILQVVQNKQIKKLCDNEFECFLRITKEHAKCDIDVNAAVLDVVTSQVLVFLLGCKPEKKDIELTKTYMEAVAIFVSSGTAVFLTKHPWLRYIPGTSFKRNYDATKEAMETMVQELFRDNGDREGNGYGFIARLYKRKAEMEAKSTEDDKLTDENVRAFVVDFVNGSAPGWSKTVMSGILCLAKHPSVQERAHSELDEVCKGHPPTTDDRDKLPYLNATVLEVYRYGSILTTTVPHLATEDVEVNGFLVEKGSTLLGGLYNMNHSEVVWSDPWTFRPERFLDTSGQLLSPDHPLRKSLRLFGSGPRNCKGYPFVEPTIFACFGSILYHFRILPPTEGELPDCDSRTFQYGAALVVPPFMCKFEQRATE